MPKRYRWAPGANESHTLDVVIETPKGSRNKYRYEEETGFFRLAHILPEGMAFPFDFGFVPGTKAEDGDPLDVLVLSEAPLSMGCILRVRVIGVIAAKQRDKGKEQWVRNDRLVAVATYSREHENIEQLADLDPHVLDDFEAFFVNYNKLRGKKFKPKRRSGPKAALTLIEQASTAFKSAVNT